MALKLLFLILTFSLICESVLFSSFWAPIFDRRILNYRVDLKFDPESGKNNRKEYEQKYGYRGEALIADLGKGTVPEVPNNDSNKGYVHVAIKTSKDPSIINTAVKLYNNRPSMNLLYKRRKSFFTTHCES